MIERLVIDDSSAPSRAALLADFLAEVWGRPYQLALWDCILFIAAWADRLEKASTLPRHLTHTERFRSTYEAEHEGIRLWAPRGINDAIRDVLLGHGWSSPGRSAGFEVGDIILTDLSHPGIWDGSAILAQPARASGLLHVHASHAVSALRWPTSGSRT